jgi:hypothetical protein
MKRWITIAMFGLLLLPEIPLLAQNQPPAGAQASPPDQSAPTLQQPQAERAPAPQTPAPVSPETKPQTAPPPASKPNQTPKRAKRKKPGTRMSAPGQKVVIRNGGARDQAAQLAPGMSKEQELNNRETTARLLATTDANLKSIAGRQLTTAQQSLLDQIHTYMRQSKDASDSGDLARAHTLAYKAHLLSDELRK